jgi:hypothetical protein
LVYEFDASKEKKKKLNLPFPIVKSLKNPNQNSNDNHSYSSNVIFSNTLYIRQHTHTSIITFLRFPVTLMTLRSDFPTLKSTAVIPPWSLNATCAGAKPITQSLFFFFFANKQNQPSTQRNFSNLTTKHTKEDLGSPECTHSRVGKRTGRVLASLNLQT